MLLLLTIGIIGGAMLIMSIALILTGENKVHSSCAATHELDGEGESCAFCPNDEDEDQLTTLSKAGYPGRKDIVSQEAYKGKPERNIVVERLKYNSGRD
ncbi:MAG: hypothetical protein HOB84_07890 [Candidatus Marinimicrobia bacterium]|jgi:hypothetical protein|nr:hypothetical protein [Candidatus Neomarinimicrobiota bacterium]MBT4362412.1 hypothetical protein [Candidatus Neomarinimicrobiota bacterium]MBT4714677.1 hypothetical protein [Candidatus Neomarinimicrobiota bacterium]MBT4945365.1 hypothetical protein [Candidatus Neomarinimicrobiota bacterium]MBT5270833.1 hypothetical protein [Candidatus Neomarinimicrobiota bacterium]